jgi:endonuclease I
MRCPHNSTARLSAATSFRVLAVSLLAASTAFADSDAPIHYYDAANGKTGAALKSALQNIVANHTVIPYTATQTDTWDAVKVLDQAPSIPDYVVLVYSELIVSKSEQYNGMTGTWEREHLWPQSFGIIAFSSSSRAKSDLFNLRPIDRNVNGTRSNKYYDSSTAPISMHPEAPGSTYDNNSWEPRQDEKGTIARAMFYMAVRYDGSDPDVPDLELSDFPDAAASRFGKLSTLLAWHRQFAVAPAERVRNAGIYFNYQHNRNPFVDHPDYAEMVFLGLSPGQAWKDTHFTDAELANPAISGDDADPDQDGLSNLLEYAFNRDPRQSESSPAVIPSANCQGGTCQLAISYSRNRSATDVAVAYEWSSDLKTWTGAAAQVISAIPTSSETERVTVRLPASAAPYFARIGATRTTLTQPAIISGYSG